MKNSVEMAVKNKKVETEQIKNDLKTTRIELSEWHSKEYLNKKLKTTYKGKQVVFILPNGKEYINEK